MIPPDSFFCAKNGQGILKCDGYTVDSYANDNYKPLLRRKDEETNDDSGCPDRFHGECLGSDAEQPGETVCGWSAVDPDRAWLVDIGYGYVGDRNKVLDEFVWPVRSGN